MTAAGFVPARVVTIDVDQPLPALDGEERLVGLVRRGAIPLGSFDVDVTDPTTATSVVESFGSVARTTGTGERPPTTRSAAVVVATRDRPQALRRCLESIARSTVEPAQIVVVDNAPSSDESRHVVEAWNAGATLPVNYLREDRAGLATAHNAALPILTTDVVAFTDDDVRVDPYWLESLLAGFDQTDDVRCVTGMIFPAALDTWPQQWVESHAGFNKGFEVRTFDLADNRPADPLFPFTAGTMGSGANMAFDVAYLRAADGFDEALGAGTIALGGDDLRAFYDVVASGHRLVYQPAAIVHHDHHRDVDAIRRQAHGYGASLTAYLTSIVFDDPRALFAMLRRAPGAVRHARRTTAPPASIYRFPMRRRLSWLQRLGMLSGPGRYLRSARATR